MELILFNDFKIYRSIVSKITKALAPGSLAEINWLAL